MKEIKQLYANISDIYDTDKENVVGFEIDLYGDDTCEFLETQNVILDLSKMGMSSDMEFEFQMSKDFINFYARYYEENKKIPTVEEVVSHFEGRDYLIIELPNEDEEEIEMNEVVKNDLFIKNLNQLSYSIYQTDDLIEDENKANECIKCLMENLQRVYEFIDEDLFNLCEDNEVMQNAIQETMREKGIDLYQIGDIINFIDTINIRKEGK